MRMPVTPPPMPALLRTRAERIGDLISSGIGRLPENKYLHWSKLKYVQPPEGFSSEDWWLAVKMARFSARHALPFADKQGRPFAFSDSGYLYRMLHQVDQGAGGRIELPADVVNADSRNRYLVNSLIEEAIASSQLEGAATPRLVAKDMLRSGRPPRDRSERMIVNNYRGMEFLSGIVREDLSVPILLDLHRILTEGTFDDPDAAGRFRLPSDRVFVTDPRDGAILHEPPDASALGERMERLFAFANTTGDEPFVHPVVKAILLHFMIGYEHPFVDGNGRTARALFYWAMARFGYWMTEFLSISTIIRKAPVQYARAYVLSETDDNDVTYFLDYHLRVILRSIRRVARLAGAQGRGDARRAAAARSPGPRCRPELPANRVDRAHAQTSRDVVHHREPPQIAQRHLPDRTYRPPQARRVRLDAIRQAGPGVHLHPSRRFRRATARAGEMTAERSLISVPDPGRRDGDPHRAGVAETRRRVRPLPPAARAGGWPSQSSSSDALST